VAIDTGPKGVTLTAENIHAVVALAPDPNTNPLGTAFTLLLMQDQPVAGVTP
jgi:hypothetical protein